MKLPEGWTDEEKLIEWEERAAIIGQEDDEDDLEARHRAEAQATDELGWRPSTVQTRESGNQQNKQQKRSTTCTSRSST